MVGVTWRLLCSRYLPKLTCVLNFGSQFSCDITRIIVSLLMLFNPTIPVAMCPTCQVVYSSRDWEPAAPATFWPKTTNLAHPLSIFDGL